MSKSHHLKTDHLPFVAIRNGEKTAEFRRDDRGYQIGDRLVLLDQRRDIDTGFVEPTGDREVVYVTHVQRGGEYGIPSGYVMLSFSREATR